MSVVGSTVHLQDQKNFDLKPQGELIWFPLLYVCVHCFVYQMVLSSEMSVTVTVVNRE